MSEYSLNKLKVIGNPDEIKKVMDRIRNGSSRISFGKILPMPDGLRELTILQYEHQKTMEYKTKLTPDDLAEYEKHGEIVKEFEKRNLEKYGFADSIAWCNEHWGTKWDAMDRGDKKDTDDTIHFQTAWCPPLPITLELSKQFPDLTFEISFLNDGYYTLSGCCSFLNGKIIAQDVEIYTDPPIKYLLEINEKLKITGKKIINNSKI